MNILPAFIDQSWPPRPTLTEDDIGNLTGKVGKIRCYVILIITNHVLRSQSLPVAIPVLVLNSQDFYTRRIALSILPADAPKKLQMQFVL